MKPILTIILFSLLSLACIGQTKKDCKKLLSKKISLDEMPKNEDLKDFTKNIEHLYNCDILTQEELYILEDPVSMTDIFMQLHSKGKDLSNIKIKDLVEGIKLFAETEKDVMTLLNLLNKTADINNWEEDKKVFEMMKWDTEMMYKLMKENPNAKVTYKNLYSLLEREVKEDFEYPKFKELEEDTKVLFVPYPVYDYKALLAEAKEKQKPLLLYFTGHAVVNSKKMEALVLSDSLLFTLLKEEFVFAPLYVDDDQLLKETEEVETKRGKRRLLKTVGNKTSYLQLQNFEKNEQPYFVIVDSDGTILSEIGYTLDKERFLLFIGKGLAVPVKH